MSMINWLCLNLVDFLQNTTWHIATGMQLALNHVLKKLIMLVHAFSTSAIFWKGKMSIWNLLEKSTELQEIAEIFNNLPNDNEAIFKAGCKAFLHLYGAQEEKDLNKHRFALFKRNTLLKNILSSCKKGCGNGCGCRKLGIKFMKIIKMR